ncbi:hypothetical protein MN608_08083 [Microdochium nivale]|nr:hypothetical protein MN608_08083 [Microdochium nivale]
MRFSILSTAVATLALYGNAVQAALTPSQIVDNIETITQKSRALKRLAQSISIDGPLITVGQGPLHQLIVGFTEINIIATTTITQIQGTSPITNPADATLIVSASRKLLDAVEVIVRMFINGSDFGVVSAALFWLSCDIAEPSAQDLMNRANALRTTIDARTNAYEGLANSKRALAYSASFRTLRA